MSGKQQEPQGLAYEWARRAVDATGCSSSTPHYRWASKYSKDEQTIDARGSADEP